MLQSIEVPSVFWTCTAQHGQLSSRIMKDLSLILPSVHYLMPIES
jgi:hypothetical protein